MWGEAIDDWVEELRLEGCAMTTIRTRRQHLEQLSRERTEGPWEHTTGSLLEWVVAHEWSIESRHAARSSLRSFYGHAVIAGRTTVDPAARLPRVKRRRGIPRPTPDDVYTAALANTTPRVRLMIRLGAEAGLRRGEIARIHTRDIVDDVVGWSLNVRGKGGQGSITRTVPLPDLLALDMLSAADCTGWLFPGGQGGHLAPQRVGDLVSAALPGDWTAHSLRHRAGTRWFRLDHDLLTVRDLLGHSSVATTQGYVAVEHDDARRTVTAGAVS